MQGLMQAVSVAYLPMTRSYWATSAAGHVTVIDPRGPTRITDYVRNTRQAVLEPQEVDYRGASCQPTGCCSRRCCERQLNEPYAYAFAAPVANNRPRVVSGVRVLRLRVELES